MKYVGKGLIWLHNFYCFGVGPLTGMTLLFIIIRWVPFHKAFYDFVPIVHAAQVLRLTNISYLYNTPIASSQKSFCHEENNT